MSLGNLQYHFPGKAELIDAVLQELIQEYLLFYKERFTLDTFSPQALQELISKLLHNSYSDDETSLFRALFSFPEKDVDPALKRFYARLYDLTLEGLAELSGQSSDSPMVKHAADIIYPYIDGYELTCRFLEIDIEMTSSLLGKFLYDILTCTSKR